MTRHVEIPSNCHSERSEESMRSPAGWCPPPWILRCAQNDKRGILLEGKESL